jgi:hypothetical protein
MIEIKGEKLKRLDDTLLEMALTRFEDFCKLTNIDKVQAFVCLEKRKGKSLRQIGNSLGLSKTAIENRCKKCDSNLMLPRM